MQTIEELKRLQAQPLDIKIKMTEQRIMQWVSHYGIDGCYISFSGGKDSTVLLHIARRLYPNIKAVFVDVPTQYPELRTFAESFDNIDIIRPKISFMQVCDRYGFPLISKEVSECVSGARKYLTRLIENGTVPTDRQTDRQTDSISIPIFTRKSQERVSTANFFHPPLLTRVPLKMVVGGVRQQV